MSRALRLLLVEDHDDSADLLAELLKNHGYSVRIARNAGDALTLASVEVFDVVVSDVGLPDASGYELMEKLRDRMKGIAITGSSGDEAEARGRQAGFSAHLTKPVSVRRLEQALADLDVS
jgi:two-component system, chemotaxis family, CheB/CheR fusion protein